jgi:tRNA (cmo5U34)-methyltransferase
VVSSLAIHHLDGTGKRELFRDVYRMLEPGGAFLIADLVMPASEAGLRLAARSWDEAVRERSLRLLGDERAFERFEEEKWNLYRYPDPEVDRPSGLYEQLTWLREAGFENVDVSWMRAGHAVFGGTKP